MRIAVLIACHNRRRITLQCLDSLVRQLAAKDSVYLFDDGSNDGTSCCVQQAYPLVKIIKGDGSYYWSKSMRKAWEASVADGVWDGWLWLNDDTLLDDDAISRVMGCALAHPNRVVVGALRDAITHKRIYGVCEDGLFCGNCVYVPKVVFDGVGMISDAYCHAWGDFDYAHRCKKMGIGVAEAASPVGSTRSHPLRPSLKGLSLKERWGLLWQPKGWCVQDLWTYRARNYGMIQAICSSAHLILHVLTSKG